MARSRTGDAAQPNVDTGGVPRCAATCPLYHDARTGQHGLTLARCAADDTITIAGPGMICTHYRLPRRAAGI